MDQHSKIAILGFGVEGRVIMKWLHEHQYGNITVCDRNVDLDYEMPEGVSVHLGETYLNDLTDFDTLFRSPGISTLKTELQEARAAGVEMTSSINFFMDQCPCPVIGVTGTKGKGTTSTLIYEILKKSGLKENENVFFGGNIGLSPINFLDKLNGSCFVVLELSSFQLHDVDKAPHYAVVLNTTIDHMDYHADKQEYMEAKEKILTMQNEKCIAVLNKDYEYSKYYKPLVKGALREVSVNSAVDDGAFVKDGIIFYAKGGKSEEIMKVSEITLVGPHNIENVLPAVTIALELGIDKECVRDAVMDFKNLPHRLEFVRDFKGVKFYNDSFSTNVQTSIAAVNSFDEPTVLIAGGHDKGFDYYEWAKVILTKDSLETVILIGGNAQKLEDSILKVEEELGELVGSPTKVLRRESMEEAVLDAFANLENGGVVVLSPAAASFDMYDNYKERGNDFASCALKMR